MAENSKIEWTDNSWNPFRARNLKTGKVGWYCEHKTDGCVFCYAEGMNKRLGTGLPFKPGHRKDVELFLDEEMLRAPLRWRGSKMVFVCSMTDAFADFVTDEWLDKMFAVMAMCPQHTFQVLTKRPERMREYCGGLRIGAWRKAMRAIDADREPGVVTDPPPNVWLGTSCEDQDTFIERSAALGDTPAAVRFFSFEPLLDTIDTGDVLKSGRFHWAIVGGESGPKARPTWVPSIRKLTKQCQKAGVPVFVKQLGANVQDRNDAGFDGCYEGEWPDVDPARIEHDVNGFREEYQGAPVRIRLDDRKGGNMNEWPEDLRVREFPRAIERSAP